MMYRKHFTRALFLALAVLGGTGTAAAAQPGRPPQSPPADLSRLDLEQLMQLEVVYAASKRNQDPRKVASVVSVVTAAEIRQHGYRTLGDVLRSLPSFFVSYDRNYTYLGVRGFSQPGDYSSRVLLLVNGLRTNDNIYDQAAVGEEFIVDVDLIDRVEVVRGPSAAIYGSSAFFAVINVVTKWGSSLDGAEISASGASFGTYAGRATYGMELDNGIEMVASATISDAAGASRLYFPEFDDPSTNGGIARNADGESFHKLFTSVAKGSFSFEASHVSRAKDVPTASYETLFNDRRNRTVDRLTLASLTYDRPFTDGSASARVHSGRYTFDGEYAYDPAVRPDQDMATGEWWGIELDAARSFSTRTVLTVGAEYRDNYRQAQKTYSPEPPTVWFDTERSSHRLGVFAQNELTLFTPLILYTGVRHDWYDTFGTATSPRIGVIYNPGEATTLKFLLGRAFRAPNEYELHYGSRIYKLNPGLGPERIETIELAVEHRIGNSLRLTASGYRNQITDLITLERDPADDLLVFRNVGRIDSDGLELGLSWNRGRTMTADLSATWQATADHETGAALTNSPRRMAKLRLVAPLSKDRLSAGMDAHYVRARGTLAGAEAKEYVLTNLTLLAPRLFQRFETSASVYNLFATKYGHPGSEEHAQDIIQQDGRSFRVKATLRF
jgi:iron complex outermembrane receptor protein